MNKASGANTAGLNSRIGPGNAARKTCYGLNKKARNKKSA